MKHPFENHSEREPRWRRPADDPRGPDTVTFIPSTAGCGFVAVDSKPLPHPHARFNRWLYEPLLILTLPLVTMLSLFLAFLFVTLQSWIGDVSARLRGITFVLSPPFWNSFPFLRRPRHPRRPSTP